MDTTTCKLTRLFERVDRQQRQVTRENSMSNNEEQYKACYLIMKSRQIKLQGCGRKNVNTMFSPLNNLRLFRNLFKNIYIIIIFYPPSNMTKLLK
jgi:hypothetical protein